MALVADLAAKVKQVGFAVGDERGSPLSGVHMDGTRLLACNKHVAARVPLEIPVAKAITAPLASLSGALKRADEILMGSIGQRLVLMPDEDTTISSVLIEGNYPDTDKLWAMTKPADQQVEFDAAEALSVLARILVLCKTDQYPTCSVTFTEGAMVLDMEVPDLGRVTDEVSCKSIIDESYTIKFSPRELRDVFTAAVGTVQMFYQRDAMKAVRVDGYGDFSSVLMPKWK
jgi:DNA polymerase III sliding clamp (beta) subunit (PCNA family)